MSAFRMAAVAAVIFSTTSAHAILCPADLGCDRPAESSRVPKEVKLPSRLQGTKPSKPDVLFDRLIRHRSHLDAAAGLLG
jgi:hypothetical protein